MLETVILNVGYILLVSAAFTRTLGRLRLLLIGAALALAVYGAIAGIWSMMMWNTTIGVIHSYRFIRDVTASRAIALTDTERAVRDEYFAGTSDFDFNVLWGMGRDVEHNSSTIIAANSQPDCVSMLLDGEVVLQRDGVAERRLGRGALLGEMSFVSGELAEVDVVAAGAVAVREWDQRHLKVLDQTHPPAAKAMNQLVSRDLVAKARG